MLFGRKKYYFSYLSALTAFITVFYLVLGPLFLSFESSYVPKAQGASVTWVAGATGTWETGANWSTGVVPTSADDVTISSSTGNILVTLSSGQTANFSSLTIGGDSTYFATTTLAGNIGTGGAITVSTKGVLEQSNFTNQTITGTLTIASGGRATHTINTAETAVQDKGFVFTAPNFNLQSGSLLDVSGKGFNQTSCAGGFARGFGPGASATSDNDDTPGASHGGVGGSDHGGSAGNLYAYGDLTAPYEHGSSAARMHFDCGGSGGGTVKLTVTGGGTATISGTVTSTGTGGPAEFGRYGGGGSGGSVWLNFTDGGTFTGSGAIGAAGGNAPGTSAGGGGGGGGGRIAITGHSSDTYTGTFYYAGGNGGGSGVNNATNGGAGTLYKKMSSATYGDLHVDNGSIADFTPTHTSSTMTLANIWLNGKANLFISTSTVLTLTSSTLGVAYTSSSLNVDGSLVTPSTFTIPAYNQVYASTTQISAITDLTIKANGFLEIDSLTSSSAWSLNTLTVDGELSHRANRDTIANALSISATTITVGSTGAISADFKGYDGGNNSFTGGAGVTQYNGFGSGGGTTGVSRGGGGAYGGYGGYGGSGGTPDGAAGTIYGATSTPEYEAGSGGGGGARSTADDGGSGGGIIKIAATTLTVNGRISTNGQVGGYGGAPGGSAGGGGSGGGIKITATTLTGSGSITANGGPGGLQGGGGGGGGRILVVTTNSTFSGTVTSTAGLAGADYSGQPGTPGSATIAPGVPLVLYASSTSALTGTTNPTLLNTSTPFFSAIFADVETGDTATKAQIQVSTDATFASVTHWDSGSSGTSITSCAISARCQSLKYGNFGSAPTLNLSLNDDADENSQTTYYWRLRFFDAQGGAGSYSTSTDTFTLLDAPNEPSGAAVSSISATGATISWTDNSAIETSYAGEVSTVNDDSVFTVVTYTAANATSFTTTTLSPDTRYRYRVAGVNSAATSTYSTTTAFYTLANAAGTPTVSAASASSLIITINPNSNPTTTAFAIYNETSGNYVAADGSASASAVYQTTSTWGGVDITATGLSANTSYQFSVIARNQSNSNSATSTASTATYTLASIPTGLTLSASGSNIINASWNANGNPAGTIYNIVGVGNAYSSGDITSASHQFTGLNPGTYSFRVRTVGHGGVATAYTDAVSVTLAAGDSGCGGACPPPPPPPPPPPDLPPCTPGSTDCPDEDFKPNGLIKIVSQNSGEIDLLKEAGSGGQLNIKNQLDVKTVADSTNELLDLQNPFKLDFSFSLPTHPFWANAPAGTEMFQKGNAYQFGLGTNQKNTSNPGFCFAVNGNSQRVCDNIFNTSKFAPNKKLDYKVIWDGSMLKMYDGNTEVSTKSLSNISNSAEPLLVGGTSYVSNNKTYISPYPMTIYQMTLKSEPTLIYTNNPNVKLKIDATYTPEFALKESSDGPSGDFSNVSFNPITSEMLWNFSGPDGKKCVNARFRSALKKFSYDTFACIILDRVKPPATFTYDSGYDKDNKPVGPARFSGITEGDASVTVFVEVIPPGSNASAGKIDESSPTDLYESGSIWLAGTKPELELAATLKSQFSLKANKDGTWTHTSAGRVTLGTKYTVSVQTRDLAGNLSDLETQEFIIGEEKPLPCDPTKETCPEPPCEETGTCEPPCEETGTCEPVPCEETGTCEPPCEETGTCEPVPCEETGTCEEKGFFGEILDTITETITEVVEVIAETVAVVVEKIVVAYKKVREFVNRPEVQAINKTVVVPGAAAIAAVNAAVGFQLPYLINLLRYLFSQPAMLWRRRKQKTWGVVYNSFTKEPVDLATIRLIDEKTGKVIASQVTDFHGRYFMSTNTGQFRLEVIKPDFIGFSEHLKEKDEDTTFTNLYHGAAFYAPRDQFEINYNIPLDPIVENKPVAKILRDNLWEKIQYGLSFAGMGASLMSFVVTPKPYTFAFVCLHVGLFALFYRFAHHKLPPVWGVVREFGTKNPVGRVIVRVFDSAYNKLVNTGVTDSKGRYALLVGPSKYYVSYEKAGYTKKDSPILDYSSRKTDGMGGIINRDELIVKAGPGKEQTVAEKSEPNPSQEPGPEAPKTDMDKVNDDINKWKESNY